MLFLGKINGNSRSRRNCYGGFLPETDSDMGALSLSLLAIGLTG
jgi:hypothetical protein